MILNIPPYDVKKKVKVEVLPRIGHQGSEGDIRFMSTLSLTSALLGDGWSTPRQSHFTPGKEAQYPLCRRLGGTQGRSKMVQKILPTLGFDPWTVQPLAICYTDWGIAAHYHYCTEVRLSHLCFMFTEESCVHPFVVGVQVLLFASVTDCRHNLLH